MSQKHVLIEVGKLVRFETSHGLFERVGAGRNGLLPCLDHRSSSRNERQLAFCRIAERTHFLVVDLLQCKKSNFTSNTSSARYVKLSLKFSMYVH